MNFDPNDAMWTSYILEELDAAEKAAVEAVLAESPEARAWVEGIRGTVDALRSSYAKEPDIGLEPGQKARIQSAAKGRSPRFPNWAPLLAAAACVCILAVHQHVIPRNPAPVPPVESSTPPVNVSPVESPSLPEVLSPEAQPAPEMVVESVQPLPLEKKLQALRLQMNQELAMGDLDQAEASGEAILQLDRYNHEVLRSLSTIAEKRWEQRRGERTASVMQEMSDGESRWLMPQGKNERFLRPEEIRSRITLGSGGGSGGGIGVGNENDITRGVTSSSEVQMLGRTEIKPRIRVDQSLQGLAGGLRYFDFARESGVAPAQSVISPSQDDFGALRTNRFERVLDHPLSTFSIDVDTASYSVVRKFLNEGRLPPADAVRVEEMINYFPYAYAPPTDGKPFAAQMDLAACPWQPGHQLVRIGLQGREIPASERPALNLVYLIDVSGSMQAPNKLPLVKRALSALVKQLDERDHVSIVVYAGAAGLVLPATSGVDSGTILEAINRLEAGGSTAGGAGIQLAYATALTRFSKDAANRVILCTDGDFNVGLTQRGELERLIEEKAKSGVFLTVLGFGMGNYKDSTLELLSNKGNGNYAYIDDFNEARKVLVEQMAGTLVTIAKDVKIQVEFNPARVSAYRLIGYENRMLQKEDFNNDKVDAGEIGAGHSVTALYELVPAGSAGIGFPPVDALKYQTAAVAGSENDGEILTLKIRYKEPDGDESSKLEFPLMADRPDGFAASPEFRFATAVAGFGLALRDPAFLKQMSYERILELAETSLGEDRLGYRAEFLKLVRNARAIPRN